MCAMAGVDLSLYRSTIARWASLAESRLYSCRLRRQLSPGRTQSSLVVTLYLFLLLRAAALPADGDIQLNPGPLRSLDSNSNSGLPDNRKPQVNRPCPQGRGSAAVAQQLSLYYFNARSLLPKKSELSQIVTSLKPTIVAVTETWLSPSVPDGAIALPGYSTVVRVDRSTCGDRSAKKKGGGVLFLIHNSVRWVPRPDLRIWPESVWIEVKLRSFQSLIIGCVYRPPDSDVGVLAQALESTINSLDLNRSHLVVVGDFNAKCPSWLPSDNYNPAGQILEPVLLQLGLHQLVTTSTHLSSDGGLGSLLDLVLTSTPSIVSNVSTTPPLGSSDHLAVLCLLNIAADRVSQGVSRRIWSFDRADFNQLNKILNEAAWPDVFDAPDMNAAWEA